uniref:hypothetical protein n=1 Tax=Halobacterium hubeiense TaxID=1407499 RepID=UPI00351DC60C
MAYRRVCTLERAATANTRPPTPHPNCSQRRWTASEPTRRTRRRPRGDAGPRRRPPRRRRTRRRLHGDLGAPLGAPGEPRRRGVGVLRATPLLDAMTDEERLPPTDRESPVGEP